MNRCLHLRPRPTAEQVARLERHFELAWASPYTTATPNLTAALRGSPGKRRRRRPQPKALQETLW